MARYVMWDGNFVSEVKLPASASEGSLIFIDSHATFEAKINPLGLLYASTFLLRKGDSYILQYKSGLKAWVPYKTPVRRLGALQAGLNMAAPSAPKTEVVFRDGDWIGRIILPRTAGDRDKIVIKSSAADVATLDNAHMDFQGSKSLSAGDTYEFIFIKEKGVWQMLAGPRVFANPLSLVAGQLPNMSVPITEYRPYDGGWHRVIKLPVAAKMGDVVIVRSNATLAFTVAKPYGSAGDTVTFGDTVRYVYKGEWVRATRIVTLLSVYSNEVAAHLGEGVIRARMIEGARLTNEALENSNSNFYIKNAGFLKRASLGETQNLFLERSRNDSIIQGERNRVSADGVYYEGLEGPYCGLAYVRSTADTMVATGNTGCGTAVMRHEFGHNMGLHHADFVAKSNYAKGYALVGTVMGGNVTPYFSSPHLYTSDYGIPMGIENQVDGVRAMDERSLEVSNFRGEKNHGRKAGENIKVLKALVADNRGGGKSYVLNKGERVDEVLEGKYGIPRKTANLSKNASGANLYSFVRVKEASRSPVSAALGSVVEKRTLIEFNHSVLLAQKVGDIVNVPVAEVGKTFKVAIDSIEISQGVARWSGHSVNADPASNKIVISQVFDADYAVGTLSTPTGEFNIEATKGKGWIINQKDDFVEEDDGALLRKSS
ncbi:hypothetical protein C7A12_08525 [Pseudomonas fluorescens]|nr:hypothetical protein C7A12_08525 [Pseudomonas fluorescens]PRW81922.1 hypothetical protein C7A13_04205 [Pseudomonas fluorescens]